MRDDWTKASTLGWITGFDGPWRTAEVCETASWRWMREASCRQLDSEQFFATESRLQRTALDRVCRDCPVRVDCLAYALNHGEEGWWGGTSDQDRRFLRKHLRPTEAQR